MNERHILQRQGKLCICFIFQLKRLSDSEFLISKGIFCQTWRPLQPIVLILYFIVDLCLDASIPANICWSSRRLQHVFSVTRRLGRQKIVTLKKSWRRLEDVLKTCPEDVLKKCWRHILRTSWRHYGDKQNSHWGYLYLTNLNVYLTNLYFTNLYLTILRRIQNSLIRTQ